MPAVISDTSPLSALAEIDELPVLKRLYGKIVIPQTVENEARHPKAPRNLRILFQGERDWLSTVADPEPLIPEVFALDPGEAAAISLAVSYRSSPAIIVDDLAARDVARNLGLKITGTAGVLFAAGRKGLTDFESALDRLQATHFRLSHKIADGLLSAYHE